MATPGQILKFIIHEVSLVDEAANTYELLAKSKKGDLMSKFQMSTSLALSLKNSGFDMEKIAKALPEDFELDPKVLSQKNAPEPQAKSAGSSVQLTEKETAVVNLMQSVIEVEKNLNPDDAEDKGLFKSLKDLLSSFSGKNASAPAAAQNDSQSSQASPELLEVQKSVQGLSDTVQTMGELLQKMAEAQLKQAPAQPPAADPAPNEGAPPSDEPVNKGANDGQAADDDIDEEKNDLINKILAPYLGQNEPVNKSGSADSQENKQLEEKVELLAKQVEALSKLRRGSNAPITEGGGSGSDSSNEDLNKQRERLAGGKLGDFETKFMKDYNLR